MRMNDKLGENADALAASIAKISEAMLILGKTRLARHTIVALIHDSTKVPKKVIHTVLNDLESLEKLWLKPKAKKETKES